MKTKIQKVQLIMTNINTAIRRDNGWLIDDVIIGTISAKNGEKYLIIVADESFWLHSDDFKLL